MPPNPAQPAVWLLDTAPEAEHPEAHLKAHPNAHHYQLAPEKLLRGNPAQTVWMQYTDASEKFCAGIWRSEPGAWRIAYTEEEYCQLLSGESVITDTAGHAVRLRAGDRFVIPRGFVGTWDVVETTTKHFVIYEPGEA